MSASYAAASPTISRLHDLREPDIPLSVELTDEVVAALVQRRQRYWFTNERGGQLFAKVHRDRVRVVDATGPRRGDRASMTSYLIHKAEAQCEIDERYGQRLHFIGDWHTHPQQSPRPTLRDYGSMRSLFETSRHGLHAVVMLIVGYQRDPWSWWCSVHNDAGHVLLSAARDT